MSESEALEPLPAAVPVFPLIGAVLLPRGVLPLNIFEPRYLAMVKDAMAATGAANRTIGMIQPKAPQGSRAGDPPPLYKVGCLGRITEYRETDDGRILVTLVGISRFRVGAELERDTLYRQVMTDYHGFADDRAEEESLDAASRASLEDALRPYLDARGLAADWEAVQSADDEGLVTALAGALPFDPPEKQALLEAPTLAERAQTLGALMSFAVGPNGIGGSGSSGRLQ
ncbi:LON peptidase substrate-binding domain-containing protein [Sandarakinorhabdus limnophila]|jgi:Lon protease-like protein|uniref:LON peptidase substrate-binding domain-containing protein n=1 Tax=Sandarakinorhabdus limnophila TaxID=210512 RepID=UPI0026F293E8|nr:LON peptidase substrate-binding domain-containing protein [Sandarakinorhabdus limnophila]